MVTTVIITVITAWHRVHRSRGRLSPALPSFSRRPALLCLASGRQVSPDGQGQVLNSDYLSPCSRPMAHLRKVTALVLSRPHSPCLLPGPSLCCCAHPIWDPLTFPGTTKSIYVAMCGTAQILRQISPQRYNDRRPHYTVFSGMIIIFPFHQKIFFKNL